jgi:hypothetical protein
VAAAAVSAGLIFWVGTARDPTSGSTDTRAPAPAPAPAPKPAATATVDPGEVVRAREQLQDVYARAGAAGVADYARRCADDLATAPQTLDFCIAFNLFSDALNKVRGPAREAEQLALIRAATPPGQSPQARLDQLRLLTGEVSVADVTRPRPERPSPSAAARPRASKAARSPPRNNDWRLAAAYRRAAAAGVNPTMLGREQRQFRRAVQGAGADRAAVDRLYQRRIQALESQARRARS